MCDVGVVGVVFCLSIMYGTGFLWVCQFLGGVVFVMWGCVSHGLYVFCFWCMVVVYVVDKGRPLCWLFLDDLEFCYGFCFCLWLCCFSCWAGGS